MTQINYHSMIRKNVLGNVGIENQNTFRRRENSVENSLRKYKKLTLALGTTLLLMLLLIGSLYFRLVDMRDAYIMHNYTYHYEGRHTTAPPLTWNTWSKVKEGENNE